MKSCKMCANCEARGGEFVCAVLETRSKSPEDLGRGLPACKPKEKKPKREETENDGM